MLFITYRFEQKHFFFQFFYVVLIQNCTALNLAQNTLKYIFPSACIEFVKLTTRLIKKNQFLKIVRIIHYVWLRRKIVLQQHPGFSASWAALLQKKIDRRYSYSIFTLKGSFRN